MRIVAGDARGRKLKELPGLDTRPTTDKVKESMFNIVQFDIEGRRVLDLFAGTGQLGCEALSRGAEYVTFVDQKKEAVRIVKENAALVADPDRFEVLQRDALAFVSARPGKYGLVFLDPPYHTGLMEKALEAISAIDIVAEHGIIVCESASDETLPTLSAPYEMGREYRYGKIKITLYHRR